jgi:hypothetical protein
LPYLVCVIDEFDDLVSSINCIWNFIEYQKLRTNKPNYLIFIPFSKNLIYMYILKYF